MGRSNSTGKSGTRIYDISLRDLGEDESCCCIQEPLTTAKDKAHKGQSTSIAFINGPPLQL
jgi:hypothetical protein